MTIVPTGHHRHDRGQGAAVPVMGETQGLQWNDVVKSAAGKHLPISNKIIFGCDGGMVKGKVQLGALLSPGRSAGLYFTPGVD